MLDHAIVESLKQRYFNLNPLLIQRSLERAKSNADLFDILDSVPQKLPVAWDEETHRWVTTQLIPWKQKI